ncbi:MAG TPA: CHASE4 domain-containing protein, partial [Allocoleopsis sp.]
MSLKRLCNPSRLSSWKQGKFDRPATAIPVLRRKALLAIGISLTSLIGVLSATSSAILTKGYANLETQLMQRNLDRVMEAYQQEFNALVALNRSWAVWDDSYQFVQHPDPEFVSKNLATDVNLQTSVDVMAYFNRSGKGIYGRDYTTAAGPIVPLDSDLAQYADLFRSLPSAPTILQYPDSASCQTGVMLLTEAPLLYATCPILTSNSQGPVAGTLLMARYVNEVFT